MMKKFMKEIDKMGDKVMSIDSNKACRSILFFAALSSISVTGLCVLTIGIVGLVLSLLNVPLNSIVIKFLLSSFIALLGVFVGYITTVSGSYFACKKEINRVAKLKEVENILRESGDCND